MKTEKKIPERSRSVLGRFYCITRNHISNVTKKNNENEERNKENQRQENGNKRSDRSQATYWFIILSNVFPLFLFQDITSASTPYNDVRCRVPQTHAIVKDRKLAQPTFCCMITQSIHQKTVDTKILQHRP